MYVSYTGSNQARIYLSVMQAVGLERQDLSHTHLAHHELESDVIIIIIIIIIIILLLLLLLLVLLFLLILLLLGLSLLCRPLRCKHWRP